MTIVDCGKSTSTNDLHGLAFDGHDIFAADPRLIKFRSTIVSYRFGLSFDDFSTDEDPKERALSVFRGARRDDDRLPSGVPATPGWRACPG